MKIRIWAFLCVVSMLGVSFPTYPQKRSATRLKEDVDLPADFSLDFKLGAVKRAGLQNDNTAAVRGTQLGQVGEEVFRTLVANSRISALTLPYQWTLSFTNTEAINASSLPDGEIRVNAGLAQLIGADRGLWAAVLSHEIAHVARRHAVKKYLFRVYAEQLIAYYESRARQGDKSAPWAVLTLRIAVPIAERKLSRNLEHDADVQGMKLMATAGYHPDSVFALHHLLRLNVGESSKFAAFFQDHPRWETRDQRTDRAYSEALQEFSRVWPNPEASPGGEPHVVAFAGHPEARENKANGTVDLHLPLYCRNAREPLSLVVHFSKNKLDLQTDNPNYRNSHGNLEYRQEIVCLDKDDAGPLNIQLPSSLVSEKYRKAQAKVDIIGTHDDLLESFNIVNVHFPRNNGHASATITASQVQSPAQPRVQLKRRTDAPETDSRKAFAYNNAIVDVSNEKQNAIAPAQDSMLRTTKRASDPQKGDNPLGISRSSEIGGGVKNLKLTPDGLADRAGLVVGDIILAADGKAVNSEQALNDEIASRKPGSKVVVRFMHIAWVMDTTVTIGTSSSNVDYYFFSK
jgi:hypothetical protein